MNIHHPSLVTPSIHEQENALTSALSGKLALDSSKLQPLKKAFGDRSNTVNELPNTQNEVSKVMGPPKALALNIKAAIIKQDKENKEKSKCKMPVRQESLLSTKLLSVKQAKEKLEGGTVLSAAPVSTSKPAGIYDPDEKSKDDPQMVTEYTQDILMYLRSIEEHYPVKEKFLTNLKITPKVRATLVNWLVEVHNNFSMELETLHLCVSVVDRYVQKSKTVERSNYQLVGTAALLLAAKYEEIYLPDISDFVYICDNAFSKKQLLQMEADITRKLDFRMGWPLSIYFLRRYSKVAHVKSEQHNMAKYILELALLKYEVAHVRPSVQAAAACCLSIAIINEVMDPLRAWTPTLIYYTKYKYSDFKDVLGEFAQMLVEAKTSKYDAVKEKYSASKFGKISLSSKLNGPLIRKLTTSPILNKK